MTFRRALFAFALLSAGACSRKETPSVDVAPRAATPPSATIASGPVRDASSLSGTALEVLAPKDADALTTIRTERLRAKAAGRTLVVFAGASWCEPCRSFHEALKQGKLPALQRFTFLEFDADEDRDRLQILGYTFREIPYFARPNVDGTRGASFSPRMKKETLLVDIESELAKWSVD